MVPQSTPVGFNLPAVRRLSVGMSRDSCGWSHALQWVHFRQAWRHDLFPGSDKHPRKVTDTSVTVL